MADPYVYKANEFLALQYNGKRSDCMEFFGPAVWHTDGSLYVLDLNGREINVEIGSWVIKTPRGVYFVRTNELFLDTFEPAKRTVHPGKSA